MPATLAGRIEAMLLDPIHAKPIYGRRGALIIGLLEHWVALEAGKSGPELPPIPTLEQLRNVQ